MFPQENPDSLGSAQGLNTLDPNAMGAIVQGTPYPTTDPQMPQQEHPLRPVIAAWMEKIRLALDYKKAKFGDTAEECMAFFDGPYDFMYTKKYASGDRTFQMANEADEELPAPSFQMTVNKVAELVQIFGPILYNRNPVRKVVPRQIPSIPPQFFGNPADPMTGFVVAQAQAQDQATRDVDGLRSMLIEWYLNYTPTELGLKDHSRRAIDEGLIKGMGLLWTERYTPKGANFSLVGSFYDSVDHLVVDPDMENIEDAKWIARKCCHPAWEVEQEYGLAPGSLKGSIESSNRQSEVNTDPDGDYDRKRGTTNDLVVYWKIWSRMGVGGRLSGMPDGIRQVLDQFGDNCFLVISEHTPYPLNVPPELIASADPTAPEAILQKLDWPIPFWADDVWPCTPIVFHEVPRCPWPMSHLKPAMGELKFINWAYSFLASKMRVVSRDFIAIKKSAGEELKDIVLHGRDLTLIEIEEVHGTISEVVQFLQHPQFNGDFWKVVEAIEKNFERRTGLTELVYGETPTQMRSATEANVKGSQLQVRPDDMAQRVEDAMSAVARKEALACRWLLGQADVQEVMGPVAAIFWAKYVNTADLFAMVRQLDYRIESGSMKKPNQERDASNLQTAMQQLFQPLFNFGLQTGNVGPVNALLTDWAKSIGMDASKYVLVPPMMPPMPPGPGPGGPAPQPGQGPAPGPAQKGPQGPPAGGGKKAA